MEFDIEKCAILIVKNGRRKRMEGIELPNQESIRTLEVKENYNYLRIKQEMKEKIIKEKIDNTQLNSYCMLCGDRDETVNQIILIHWEL